MSVPFEAGSVYLGGLNGEVEDARVVWSKGDKALPVPAGRYQVRNWSIETQHDGETWILSVSGQVGPAFEVKAGEDLALDLDTKVHVDGRLVRHGKKPRLELSIAGGNGMGVSVIRKDGRVDIGYTIVDRDGSEAGKGPMVYG